MLFLYLLLAESEKQIKRGYSKIIFYLCRVNQFILSEFKNF